MNLPPVKPQSISAGEIEKIFHSCFFDSHQTILLGGFEEPLYLPKRETEGKLVPAEIHYRSDYSSSALHEVSHWCIAGRERHMQVDYGYWYQPDGRKAQAQQAFLEAECKPQALEWIFSEICGLTFQISLDNLNGDSGDTAAFAEAVEKKRDLFLMQGLPLRAYKFRTALSKAFF